MTSGFSGNLALFKCSLLSYSLSLLFEPNKCLLLLLLVYEFYRLDDVRTLGLVEPVGPGWSGCELQVIEDFILYPIEFSTGPE